MRLNPALGAVLLAGGLAGCVAPPPPPAYVALPQAAPAQLVAVPGPGKTQAAFQQDDAGCRAAIAALPPGAAQAQPTPEQVAAAQAASVQSDAAQPPPPAEALSPGAAYLRCMTSKQNVVQQFAPAVPLYAYYPAYPIYPGIGFGYPFFYDDVFAFRFGFGFGGYGRYGYGGYNRGYAGYYRGGYGGFHGGGYGGGHGGFHGGGFGGGFHGGGHR